MRQLLEILNLSIDFLKEKGIKNFRQEAQEVISNALNITRLQLYLEYERPLTDLEMKTLREKILRRAKGEPAIYIDGKIDFLNCFFKVTPDVLIPRQETEILTDKIIKFLEKQDLLGKSLWDVCCGSGCIGISIKKKFPQLNVTLSDISSKALAVAKENASKNEVEVNFIEGDLLDPFKNQKTHFFVCNPPYIAQNELASLETEVKDYEPLIALISGESGLEFYQRLAQDLKHHLHSKGCAWFEIGANQGKALTTLFQHKPWINCKVEVDWSDKDRFFFLEIE
jgi:release factor glutamine methyltransferase